MLTRRRFVPPLLTSNWQTDGPNLLRAINEFLLGLEQKGALELGARKDWTPADASGAGLVLVVDHAYISQIGDLVVGQAKITYPATADGSTAAISGLPLAAAKQTAGAAGGDGGSVAWVLVSGTTLSPEPVDGGGVLNSALSGKTLWMSFSYYV